MVEGLARLYCPPAVLQPDYANAGSVDPTVDKLIAQSGGIISSLGFTSFVEKAISNVANSGSKYYGQKEWHHIVAQSDGRTKIIREIVFDKTELSIEDPSNLMNMKKSMHKITHTDEYYAGLNITFGPDIANLITLPNGAINIAYQNTVRQKLNKIRGILEIVEKLFI